MVLFRSIKSQSGVSLISLLVGITISLITALAMLTLFRHSIRITADTTQISKQDAERTSAMTIAPILLQDAGFGINNARVSDNIIALKGATFSASNKLSGTVAANDKTANALVWLRNLGTNFECSALFAAPDKGLLLLGPINCAGLTTWSTANWATGKPLASLGTFNFLLSNTAGTCSQFGYASLGKATITLQSNNAIGQPVSSQSCLSNLVVSP
ncbi:hypothetical protein [Iodobacter fluviatilis]|uniref:Tfp pilus assembly protein PilW n=1 Tax=Iodobacter fluviatilis TaxID=537 RepID=A0A377Q5I5_9NEIS|nr:hypothetical protein [Iodobacter fluviatilis]TCU89157.1 hypothetical protein EV682_10268 [Iodobacter fluviatilis]STQ90526.1 Tfp pilus assembly protein PilW [Iodobacter fluviatilis]